MLILPQTMLKTHFLILQKKYREICKICIAPILQASTEKELETEIGKNLPLFSIKQLEIAYQLTSLLEEEKVIAWAKESIDSTRKMLGEAFTKIPDRDILIEKIHVFLSCGKSVLETLVENPEYADEKKVLQIYSLETYCLLILLCLAEADEEDGNVTAPLRKMVEIFDSAVAGYRELAEEVFGDVWKQKRIANRKKSTPCFKHVIGKLSSIEFAPGQPRKITIRTEQGDEVSGTSDEKQIEKAISMRNSQIQALLGIKGGEAKIIWVKGADEIVNKMTKEERRKAILNRWDDVLRRLAE